MPIKKLPGFTAEHSLYTRSGEFRANAIDAPGIFESKIVPQFDCIQVDGQSICIDGGGIIFPPNPIGKQFPQCRARCHLSGKKGAALLECLADC